MSSRNVTIKNVPQPYSPITFFCLRLFIGIGPFQWVMGDSNKKISPVSTSAQSRPKCLSFPSSGSGVGPSFDDWEYLCQLILVLARNCRRVGLWPKPKHGGPRRAKKLCRFNFAAGPNRLAAQGDKTRGPGPLSPIGQPADLTSIRPVRRRNPPFAGVTAVCASQALRSSTCTMVLPICSCHERMTTSSRTTTV